MAIFKMRSLRVVLLPVLLSAALGAMTLAAQQPPGNPGPGPGRDGNGMPAPPPGGGRPSRPPVERMFGGLPPGRWWTDPATAGKLGLTADQQKQMDALFQQNRLKLIDLNASLQREEVTLEPLFNADHPDEAKVLPQIDRVAQARAELEKANARMLLGFRGVLTPEQWKKLQANPAPGPPPGRGPGGRGPMPPGGRD